MARGINRGQSIYIPFVNGGCVFDSQNRPRMYKSVEQFQKSYPGFKIEKPDLVEYAPVVHGKWIKKTVSSGRESWECSVCHRRARGKKENLPYCHCGAKMDLAVMKNE